MHNASKLVLNRDPYLHALNKWCVFEYHKQLTFTI